MEQTYIILHHSLTKDSDTVSWGAIRDYHLGLGWDDIGYHFGIEEVGDYVETFLGRLPDESGAHCKEAGMNHKSIGICLVGNFDFAPPGEKIWEKAVELVSWLCEIYKIDPINVRAHRSYASYKTCPGRLFDISKFRQNVKMKLSVGYW